jgi:hypothetical protein
MYKNSKYRMKKPLLHSFSSLVGCFTSLVGEPTSPAIRALQAHARLALPRPSRRPAAAMFRSRAFFTHERASNSTTKWRMRSLFLKHFASSVGLNKSQIDFGSLASLNCFTTAYPFLDALS